jgi:ATP-dependent DNA helicase RecG
VGNRVRCPPRAVRRGRRSAARPGLLRARSLLTRRGELTAGRRPAVQGCPAAGVPEALVRVLRYRSSERGTGSRQQLVEDVRVEGPTPRILEEVSSEIDRVQLARGE